MSDQPAALPSDEFALLSFSDCLRARRAIEHNQLAQHGAHLAIVALAAETLITRAEARGTVARSLMRIAHEISEANAERLEARSTTVQQQLDVARGKWRGTAAGTGRPVADKKGMASTVALGGTIKSYSSKGGRLILE